MLYNGSSQKIVDPLEAFYDVLRLTWDALSKEFDVQAEIPETSVLLEDVEPHDSCMAAETIIRNMLNEITQLVHRFSPWYTLPPRSFGLISFRDIITHKNDWRLAPEALRKWQDHIETIAAEIDQKNGLVKAIMFIDNVDILDDCPDDTIVAVCECEPPVELLIVRNFLEAQAIICNECKGSFIPQLA